MKNKPNFLVVGAAKSGTTSLDGYLKQHPEVFLPELKECRYFSNIKDKNIDPFTNQDHTSIIADSEDYYNLFKDCNTKVIGDISPDYLYYHEESIKNIKAELGTDTKIIIILRNPVERAYSNYLHLRRDNLTEDSFEDIINLELEWNDDIWYGYKVIKSGYYYEAVKNYIDNFKNIKIILFEEFIKNTDLQLKEISEFLEINKYFEFEEPRFKNKTGIPKNKIIKQLTNGNIPFKKFFKFFIYKIVNKESVHNYMHKLKENNLKKPRIKLDTKNKLESIYLNDIEKLEKLLNKDLSTWK